MGECLWGFLPWGAGIEKVVICDGVTSIGARAFNNCRQLISITIPHTVTEIGEAAFYYCDKMLQLEIPNIVTDIGDIAFKNCNNLVVYVNNNSIAHKYAIENGISYKLLDIKTNIGDTNLDGIITISDVTEIQKHLAEFIHFSDGIHILLYFVCVIIATLLSIGIYNILERHFPKLKNILSGNR